jgi:hypothetical protein
MPSLPETKGTDADGRAWLRRLGMAMVVCALLLGAVIAFGHLGFETNDDVAMLKLAAGLYDGRPSPYLIQINAVLGLLLKFLYEQFAHVPWWEILLLTVHFLALSLLLFVLFLRGFSWRTLFLFLVFFLVCELAILFRMSYTTTSSVAGMTGVLLVVAAFSTQRPLPRIAFAIVGGCFLVLAGLLRWYSLVAVLLLSVPLLLAVDRRLLVRVWITIGLATAASFGLSQCSQHLHEQTGWSDSSEPYRCHFALQNFPRLTINEKTRPFYREVGWDEYDVDAFGNYFSYDSRVFATGILERLEERVPIGRPTHEVISIIRDVLWNHKITILFAAALVALVLLFANRKTARIMILTAGWSLIAFLGLSCAAKMAFRVVHSLIMFDAAIAVFLLSDSLNLQVLRGQLASSSRRWMAIALAAVLAVGALLQGYQMMKESERIRVRGQRFEEYVNAVERLGSDVILVPYAGTPPLPLFMDLDKLRSSRCIPGGWLIGGPLYHAVKQNLGVTEVHEALLRREHCYLVVSAQMADHAQKFLPPFFKRHYGVDIGFETVARTGDRIIYRLISLSPADTMP